MAYRGPDEKPESVTAIESLNGGNVQVAAENTSNTASSDATLKAKVSGTSAGDAKVHLEVGTTSDWTIGVDNSDSDSLKIGPSDAVGTSTAITVTTGGATTITDLTATTATAATLNVTDSTFSIKDNSDATKVIQFQASGITTGTTRTLTAPDASTTIVGTDATQTLTNKTLTGNTAVNLVSGSGTVTLNTSGTVTLPNATDTLVGKATTDTLTNKTLTAPVISTISNTGTLTLPTSTDTLVGRDTTDTLTNKTLTSPSMTAPTVSSGVLTLPDGSQGTPSLRFADADTGLWSGGAGNVSIAVNGNVGAEITTGAVSFRTSGTTRLSLSSSGADFQSLDASAIDHVFAGTNAAGDPAFSFTGDSNTGMFSSGADTLNFATGGTQAIQVGSNQQVFINGTSAASGTPLLVVNNSTNSSSRQVIHAHASGTSYTGDMIYGHSATAGTGFNFILLSTPGDAEWKVVGNGETYSDAAYSGAGADFAEMFEWVDGNPLNEDRIGWTVALEGDKIRKAVAGDQVIGATSAIPTIVGNSGINWDKKYLKDAFGRRLLDAAGQPILNPEYDPEAEFVQRSSRKEWIPVGVVGRLRIRKDQVIPAHWVKLKDIDAEVAEYLIK